LVVDTNTIPAFPLALESLQLVAGRYSQLLQRTHGMNLSRLRRGLCFAACVVVLP
jgi:hypothetical protein